jgi:hypothetical protein
VSVESQRGAALPAMKIDALRAADQGVRGRP